MNYDLIIIGAGPAGLTASIYASCFHLKHLVMGTVIGGQLNLAPDILNYPGFSNISGKELLGRMKEQAERRGGEIVTQSVTGVQRSEFRDQNGHKEGGFELNTLEGSKYRARAIILATGMERRKLNIPGEVEYTGKGVHYCAICEKQDYDGKTVAVIGGGNSALQAAVELSDAAKKVYIIYRGTELRGEKVWLNQIEGNGRIEVLYNTVVKEIVGEGERMTGIRMNSKSRVQNSELHYKIKKENSKEVFEYFLPMDKIFIEIGGVPGTALVIPLGVEMSPGGYIKVDDKLATNVRGIFAAGDMVNFGFSIEQITTAVGLGARAAASAFAYLKEIKAPTLWGQSQINRN